MGIRVKEDNNYYIWFCGGMPTDRFWNWFNNHPGFDRAEISTVDGRMVVKLNKKYM